jgi:hypothetical protein
LIPVPFTPFAWSERVAHCTSFAAGLLSSRTKEWTWRRFKGARRKRHDKPTLLVAENMLSSFGKFLGLDGPPITWPNGTVVPIPVVPYIQVSDEADPLRHRRLLRLGSAYRCIYIPSLLKQTRTTRLGSSLDLALTIRQLTLIGA